MALVSYSDWVDSLDLTTPGASTYYGAVIQDGVAKKSPAIQLGTVPRLYVTSRNLTLEDTQGGVLTSTSAGPISLVLPTMYELGFERDSVNPVELVFLFQRGGLGPLNVTASQYRGTFANEAAMLAFSPTQVGDWVIRSDDSDHVYMHTSGSGDLAGHWTELSPGASNLPTTAGITIEWNDMDPSTLSQWHPWVALVSNGLDSWVGG